ncbi:retrovirus-related pol polyprotein from transposon tnt 1-94, partial [Nicotiana attenuata]
SKPLIQYQRRNQQTQQSAPVTSPSLNLNQPSTTAIPHTQLPSVNRPVTRSQNNISKPKQVFDYLAIVTTEPLPTTYNQAQKSAHWREAMKLEFEALMNNTTWELVPPSSSQNVVDCKWIYRIKTKPDGSVDRYKARLVAKGFTQRPDGIILSQAKYVSDILAAHNMSDCKPVQTPMSSTVSLLLKDDTPSVDATLYRQVLGKLQYLSFTRPDISFAINKLSQFMHAPTQTHWSSVKRLLRYLQHTKNHGFQITSKTSPGLFMYADADWAGDINDRTSTLGYILYLGQNPISWSSKKQRTVARSSTEAEYRAIASALAEVNWVQKLLAELHVQLPDAPTIFCDNVDATYLCQNPVLHSRMKHIEVDFHFVRDQVQRKEVLVRHLHSADQLADTLTKPLPRLLFHQHLPKLKVV